MNSRANARSRVGRQSGVVMIAMMMIMGPIIVMAFAFSTTMTGRNNLLTELVRQERAFIAAESGIDAAIYRGSQSTLNHGDEFTRDLGGGMNFSVVATHLLVDGVDNDGDTVVDEDDEDVFEVLVAGTYRGTTRRLVAYLAPVPGPPPVDTPISVYNQDPKHQLDFKGKGTVTGNDTNMDGSPGPGASVSGIAIQPPADVSDLTNDFSCDQPGRITGAGGTPSLGVSATTMDINQIVTDVKNSADIVLGSSYESGNWGDGPAGDFHIIYRDGDLQLDGYIQGAGIMVVEGKIQVEGGFRFDGVLIVLGDIQLDGSKRNGIQIYGGLVQGPDCNQLQLADDVDIMFSSEAVKSVAILGSSSGRFMLFNGWQEIGRN